MAGYSTTKLLKKLGLDESKRIALVNIPQNYFDLLELEKNRLNIIENERNLNFVHIFIKEYEELEYNLLKFKDMIAPDGMIWISWPKKSSKVETDLDENKIRNFALKLGLVDVKVCAIDEVWSALKLVWRLENRRS